MTLAALEVVPGTLLASSGLGITSFRAGSYDIFSPPNKLRAPLKYSLITFTMAFLLYCNYLFMCLPPLLEWTNQGRIESDLNSIRAAGRTQLELSMFVQRHHEPLQKVGRNVKSRFRDRVGTEQAKQMKTIVFIRGSVVTFWHICVPLPYSHIYLQTSKIRCFGIFGLQLVTYQHYFLKFSRGNFFSFNNHNSRKKNT